MKVAVLGKSRLNGMLKEQLLMEGLNPVFLDSLDEIKSISGEAGEFLIKMREETVEADCIMVSGEPLRLEDGGDVQENGKPVVILLDHPEESPAYLTEAALVKAIQLAGKQKKVFYLSRFMRVSGSGLEELYKQARNKGVVFVRYNKIDIDRDNETGILHLRIEDEYDEFIIETYALIRAVEPEGGMNAGKVEKLLKLKLDKGRYASGSSYFLSPSVTSREGVYFLEGALAGNLNEEMLQQIRFSISEIKAGTAGKTEYAEVDPGKCAFCYTCYRACPHSAMFPDYENSAMKNLNKACQACGICVSVCPADAIEIKGRNYGAGIMPNCLMVYCCENSGEIAMGGIADQLAEICDKIGIAGVSCGGELTAEKMMNALKLYEKVLCVTCMEDACRHYDGNKRARLQVARAKEMLKAAGLDENRVTHMQVSHAMPNVLRDSIRSLLK